jgi:hypothetical protein
MRYSIAFKNLPFEPEKRQVIYVENQYDERINAIIKDNYERLKWEFNRVNLEFVYFPMFFNDEEIKEKVLYYAPYLTSEIIEKTELRSSYLLGYMSHLENQDKIKPSFLYAPKREDEEWIFQGLTIDIDGDDTNAIIQWFEDTIYEIEEVLASTQQMTERRYDEDIDELDSISNREPLVEPQVEYSSTPDFGEIFKKRVKQFKKSSVEEDNDESRPRLEEIQEKDVRETFEAMGKNYEKLRLVGIPLSVIIEFLKKYETISKLQITDNLRIILPDYNIEVAMTPLHKAIYLLFVINNKKGIVLQQLENYHHELVSLYCRTLKREQLTPKQIESLNNLENSYIHEESSIHYNISKINRYFRDLIDEHLAYHYYITGKPGEPYNIPLNDNLIKWEDTYE